jgi:hypothetical protein
MTGGNITSRNMLTPVQRILQVTVEMVMTMETVIEATMKMMDRVGRKKKRLGSIILFPDERTIFFILIICNAEIVEFLLLIEIQKP